MPQYTVFNMNTILPFCQAFDSGNVVSVMFFSLSGQRLSMTLGLDGKEKKLGISDSIQGRFFTNCAF